MPGPMHYLLIGKSRTLRQTHWLTEAHYSAARRGELVIVNMATGERYGARGWAPVPPRRGEPLVMLVDKAAAEDAWGAP